jgi:hypothetical protein
MCVRPLKFNSGSVGRSASKQQFSPMHSGRSFVRYGGLRMTVFKNSASSIPISTASDGTALDARLTIGVPTREEDGVGEVSAIAMAMTLRGSLQLHSLLLPCKLPASSGLPQCSCGFYAAKEIRC